jgi:hypothetical protein
MKLQLSAATALSLFGIVFGSPAFAQEPPPPADRPANPPSSQDTPPAPDLPPTPPPPSDQAPPGSPPPPSQEPTPMPPPPVVAPTPETTTPGTAPPLSPEAEDAARSIDGFESFVPPPRDQVSTPIGEKLSPLLFTAGFGYAYAAIKHPDLASDSLSGSFIELTGGTELDHRFRLSFSLTSFQTTIYRTQTGDWAEGNFPVKRAPTGLRSQADPVEPIDRLMGGVEVQKTLHIHSIAPRLDFLPLGKQGPYIGATAGLAVIQDIGLRAGGDVALRVGGEWRPYHIFGVGIEAGAHGQLYTDSRAAIPYATARLQFYLDPTGLSSRPIPPTLRTFVPSGQRTLPVMPSR